MQPHLRHLPGGLLVFLLGASANLSAQTVPERLPGDADGKLDGALERALTQRDTIDPAWVGEAQVDEWTGTLKALLATPGTWEGHAALDPELTFRDRCVEEWAPRLDQDGLRVERRGLAGDTEGATKAPSGPGAGDRQALEQALAGYRAAPARRTAVKIVGVEGDSRVGRSGSAPEAWTRVLAGALTETATGAEAARIETTAVWRVGWGRDAEGRARIRAFEWLEEERTTLDGSGPGFVDATAEAVAEPLESDVREGLGFWRRRLDSLLGTGLLGHQGFAFADVNQDGWEDLYLCQPGGLPNKLWLTRGSHVLHDASRASGVDFLDRTSSALLLHLDGDPHVDLALATDHEVLILSGDGEGRFALERRIDAPTSTSLAAADFDLDGDLDLYVCGYVSPYDGSATPSPYHDANNGQRNALLSNEGGFEFVDRTAAVGLDQNNRRFSFAASWQDFDRDGDPDLYVSNDFGRNNLYRNDGGTFVDAAGELGVEDVSAGMGVAWGDVDNDGWDDLYVSNMFSAAGGRIVGEEAFLPGAGEDARGLFRRHARGNSLFLNREGRRFDDVTEDCEGHVSMGRWAWGSILFDANGDGRLDVLVPNGMITGEREDDL